VIARLSLVLVVGLAGAAHAANRSVGLREGTYVDPGTGAKAAVLFWYPTAAKAAPVRRGPYELDVAVDAAPAKGKFPAVVISHGSGGSTLGHHATATFLAQKGWVVATPLHVGNNYQDNAALGTTALWRARPRQVSAALDALLAEPSLAAHIDEERIAAIGFSAGGYSVLVAAGAAADLRELGKHCKSHPDDAEFCGSKPTTLAAGESPLVSLPVDKRIRAEVVMAPVGIVFADGAFSRVRIPIRLYRAENDEVLRSPYHAERVRALLPLKPEYVVVPGAGHYAFLAPFPPEAAKEVGPPAQDPPGFDRPAFQARLNAEIAAFLGRTVGRATP
jgi:predicted dienelactone hydrolase